MSAAGLTRAEGWGAIAPRLRAARQPSVAVERRCKLLLESDESRATTTLWSYLTTQPGGVAGHGIQSSEGAWQSDISQIGR